MFKTIKPQRSLRLELLVKSLDSAEFTVVNFWIAKAVKYIVIAYQY